MAENENLFEQIELDSDNTVPYCNLQRSCTGGGRRGLWCEMMFLVSIVVMGVVLALAAQLSLSQDAQDLLERAFVVSEIPETLWVALAFLFGVGAFHTPLKIVLRYFSTAVHELGHAFMAGVLLARPRSIQIHPSSSGLAIYESPPDWGRFRSALVSTAGYPAPGLAAMAAVYAVQQGYGVAWTVFAASVLALAIVFLIRNIWGFLWTTGIVVGSYFGVTQLSSDWVAATAMFVAGFLALSGIEFAWIQIRLVKHAPGSGVDAEAIFHSLGIPARLTAWVHFLLSVGAGAVAGYNAAWPYIDKMLAAFEVKI